MKQDHPAPVWPLRVAAVLFCLVSITSWGVSRTLARYVTAAAAVDSARVAEFTVSENISSRSFDLSDLTPQKTIEALRDGANYAVTVSNDSEVAVEVAVTLSLWGNLPLELRWTGDTDLKAKYILGEDETGLFAPAEHKIGNTLTEAMDALPPAGREADEPEAQEDPYYPLQREPIWLEWRFTLPANAGEHTDLLKIGWTDESGFDSAAFENGVESLQVRIEVEQVD